MPTEEEIRQMGGLRKLWESSPGVDGVFLESTLQEDDKNAEVDLLDKYERITKELSEVKAKIAEIERNCTTTRLELLMEEK